MILEPDPRMGRAVETEVRGAAVQIYFLERPVHSLMCGPGSFNTQASRELALLKLNPMAQSRVHTSPLPPPSQSSATQAY